MWEHHPHSYRVVILAFHFHPACNDITSRHLHRETSGDSRCISNIHDVLFSVLQKKNTLPPFFGHQSENKKKSIVLIQFRTTTWVWQTTRNGDDGNNKRTIGMTTTVPHETVSSPVLADINQINK